MSSRWRLAALLGLLALLCGLPTSSAGAATTPSPAALTGVTFDGTTLAGTVTVQATDQDITIDPASVKVTVAGQALSSTLSPAASVRRATVLVVDTSYSMGNAGMKVVRDSVRTFLATVPPDVEVGLVSFAATAGVEVAPTTDHAAVQRAADALDYAGDTALYDGVSVGLGALGTTGDRSLVLLSDGGDHRSKTTAAAVAAKIRTTGVRVQVVGFNYQSQAAAEAALRAVADAGGGTIAAADNAAAVAAVFRAAARALDGQVRFSAAAPAVSGSREVIVSGVANGQPFETRTVVDFGAAKAAAATAAASASAAPTIAAASTTAQTSTGGLPWVLIAGLIALFVGLLGGGVALALPNFSTQREQRVAAIETYVQPTTRRSISRPPTPESWSTSLVALGDRVMQQRPSTSRTMALLQRADLPWRPGEWAILRVVAVIVGVALGLVLFRDGAAPLGFLGGLLLGLFAPAIILRFLARRRSRQFERQMPDVLTLMASSLSTGFSLLQAMDAIAHDVAEPAAKEFARVMAETRIGSDVEDALVRMGTRMESENVRWTAMAIGIQRQVGGNLAETLRTTAATLREREMLRRHVRALSAEGRLSAYILVGLPILLFVYEVNVNRSYISLLWTTPLGLLMLIGGMVAMAIGIFWMSKVVKVEV